MFDPIPVETMDLMLKQHPFGFGEPIDIARSCICLLSEASKWMIGNNMVPDGGYSIR